MIKVTDFTTYAEVRAVLGVDEVELSDTTLALDLFSSSLQRSLRGFKDSTGKNLVTYFDDIDLLTATEDEETLYYAIKEYATYVVAETCCTGLSLFALKSDSDGKAAQSRFSSEATFKDVLLHIREKLASLTGLLEEYIGDTVVSFVPVGLSVTQPAVDRVTNE